MDCVWHPYCAEHNGLIYIMIMITVKRGRKRSFKRIEKGVGSFYFSFTDLLADDPHFQNTVSELLG